MNKNIINEVVRQMYWNLFDKFNITITLNNNQYYITENTLDAISLDNTEEPTYYFDDTLIDVHMKLMRQIDSKLTPVWFPIKSNLIY